MSKYFRIAVICIPAVILLWITVISQGVLDSGDGVQHYLIAKWAYKHPYLFLDHWGKPVFMLLASPFALLFGFKGMMIFNIAVYIFTAVLLMKIIYRLFPQYGLVALSVPFWLLAAPIYTEMILSGMTEILFAALTVWSLYLIIFKRYIAAAVVASFLPFSRPEYGVVLPLIALTLVFRAQWKALPFLFTAFIIYGFAGMFIFDDFLWFIHQHTYTGEASFYGHGEWFHFIKQYPNITGKIVACLFLIAVLGAGFYLAKKEHWKSGQAIELFFIAGGSIAGVLFVHSYIWWKGTNSSLGLIRVMAIIIPLVVIWTIWGILYLFDVVQKRMVSYPQITRFMMYGLVLIFFFGSYRAFRPQYFPIRFSEVDQVVIDAATYTKQHRLDEHKVVYQYPLFAFGLDIDIFDPEKVLQLYSVDKKQPSISMNVNDIMFWDAHFGPNESQLPLDTLFFDEHLAFEQSFFPKNKITVLGGYDFCAFILKKTEQPQMPVIVRDTLLSEIINSANEDFPAVKKTSVQRDYQAFNRIHFQCSDDVPGVSEKIFFVVAIKNEQEELVYYASEVYRAGKNEYQFLIPPVGANETLEIQVYNPQKISFQPFRLTATLHCYVKH